MKHFFSYPFKLFIHAYCLLVISSSSVGYAYIGPGAGLASMALGIGFILLILMFVLGALWYPLKMIFRKKKDVKDPNSDESEGL